MEKKSALDRKQNKFSKFSQCDATEGVLNPAYNTRMEIYMNLKKVGQRSLISLSLLSSLGLQAAPMDPSDRAVPGKFSKFIQDNFSLFADSSDTSLVYYVPRSGGIRVKAPESAAPIPSFSASAYIPTFGFFAGEELVSVGGTISTTSNLDALGKLTSEAELQGLKVLPMPVESAQVVFLSQGRVLENGRVDIQCSNEELKITNQSGQERTIKIPKCYTRLDPNQPYDLDTNVMYTFASTALGDKGTAARDLSFSAVLLPGQKERVENKLLSGAGWQDILSPFVEWKAKTERKTLKADLIINWQQLFERAEVFAAYHNWACVDVEIQGFWEKELGCKNAADCAITVQFYDDSGKKTDVAPTNKDFIDFVNAAKDKLQKELWTPIKPALDRLSTKQSAQFTMRANYQKIEKERRETVTLLWNPGSTVQSAETSFDVQCLIADTLGGKVRWDMEDPGCRALVGQ
jgi:hypothetical protein